MGPKTHVSMQTVLWKKVDMLVNSNCYLIPTSCHKSHVLKNIPYGVARRVKTLTSWSRKRYPHSTFWTEGIILVLSRTILINSVT